MTLSGDDGKLYYKLWFPLLDFVNERCKVNKKLTSITDAERLNPTDVKAVSDALCDNIYLIDEYLAQHKEIIEEHRAIILGWKNFVKGRFLIERHLKKGSIFISFEEEDVYQVVGINNSIEEIFLFFSIPLLVEATLYPFRDVIITDGLIMPYNVVFGGGVKTTYKDIYIEAKKTASIIKTLN